MFRKLAEKLKIKYHFLKFNFWKEKKEPRIYNFFKKPSSLGNWYLIFNF
jgi:hypothetical protein